MASFNFGTTRNFTPSDVTEDSFNMLLAGSPGDVVIDQVGGDQVTLTNIPINVWIPVGNAIRIRATGTTAASFMVL